MKIDPTKPVQTRDGRPVRILATDVCVKVHNTLLNDFIIGLIKAPDGSEITRRWTSEGLEVNGDKTFDLVQPKVKKWRWAFESRGINYVSWSHFEDWEAFIKSAFKYSSTLPKCIGRIMESEIEE